MNQADDDQGAAQPHGLTRRQFLSGSAGLALAGLLSGCGAGGLKPAGGAATRAAETAPLALPTPTASGIEHVVVVMMENRSFDHMLGWLPGADGRQAGLTYLDSNGIAHATHHLAPDFQGCAFNDPDHSYEGGRVEHNNGACDGWLRAGSNDPFAIGYYTQDDLSLYSAAVPAWTTFDRYFAPIMAETYPNRFYQHAGQTDRLHNTATTSTLPTIWDRLAAHGLTGRYYYSDVPFLALWGARYASISRPFSTFLSDCAAGTLPQVSYVDPRFVDEGSGTSGDDHPHADIRNGQAFLNSIYQAVTSSPNWANTVLIINYDEWGGFFDHVPPPAGPLPATDRIAGNVDGLRGFRVPCLLVAPWARRNYISHTLYDHTSVLKLITWRWNLEPLTIRDASANNLALELDFANPNLTVPQFTVPVGPFGGACQAGAPVTGEDWLPLRDLARQSGWPIY